MTDYFEEPEVEVETEDELSIEDIASEVNSEEATLMGFTPETVVTIRTTVGRTFTVPLAEPATLAEVFQTGDIKPAYNAQFYVEGAVVPADHVVAPGTTVTIVGAVKGG